MNFIEMDKVKIIIDIYASKSLSKIRVMKYKFEMSQLKSSSRKCKVDLIPTGLKCSYGYFHQNSLSSCQSPKSTGSARHVVCLYFQINGK